MKRAVNAFFFSLSGLCIVWREEPAFRLEVAMAVVMIPLGLVIGESGVERALLIGSVLLVLAVELINSAIEAAIDRISPEPHALSKKAKDAGSAAVLMALLLTGVVWLLVVFS